jgi:carboxyl-terminal processing protease
VIPLPDGSGLRLTTARYFTPSGVCINGIGITPDVVIEGNASQEEDNGNDENKVNKKNDEDLDVIFDNLAHKDDKNKTLSSEDKKQLDLKKKDRADVQLQSAINVIKGIKIYRNFQQK